jgi:DnaA family protein
LRQLALKIQNAAAASLDNFLCGRNGEAVAALRAAVSAPARETLITLWGPAGSGKSHLLTALNDALHCAGRPAQCRAGRQALSSRDFEGEALLIDDVDALGPPAAESLFHAWNRIREHGGLLVCTARQAPQALPLAPELASRLAWGAVHRLYPLDDADKLAALRARALAHGIPIAEEALAYLLVRARRDLPSLLRVLDRLDEFSLARQRPITVPLVRELLQRQDGNDGLELRCD